MRDADLFVLPSVEDAFGLVTLEAMASGLPVIVTDHVGASELISHRKDGMIVPADDPESLAAGIGELIERKTSEEHSAEQRAPSSRNGASWESYGERVLAHVDDRLYAARHQNPRVLSRNPR